MNIFCRHGRLFKIDSSQLSGQALNIDNMNALYSAACKEFSGAVRNPKYKNLTAIQRMNILNTFAENWLKQKGLI